MSDFKSFIALAASGNPLTREQAKDAFDIMMSGDATPSQIGGFLMALRVRGETIDELSGAVQTMRAKMLTVDAPEDAIDIVGTGGDGSGSYNVSTATAFVVAGAGVPVAKHGNRALSSKSGAADTLMALGINLDIDAASIGRCIHEAGIGFMFAPMHHSAMKHVGPSRVELGTRTIFNLLGPMSNPAGVKRQLLGVFSPEWVEPLAHAMRELGSDNVWVVHGEGLDEITTTGVTQVSELKDGKITNFEINPVDLGIDIVTMDVLKGGDADHNAKALRNVLNGEKNAYRDITLLNSAAALVVAGKADNLELALATAAVSIDSGAAMRSLEALITASNA